MEMNEIETALADRPEVLAAVRGLAKPTAEAEAELTGLRAKAAALDGIVQAIGAKDAGAVVTDFNALKSVRDDLIGQRDKWKATGKPVDSPEYLALQEQIAETRKQIDAFKSESEAAKADAAKAHAEKIETDLRAGVIDAAAKANVTDREELYIILRAKGLTGTGEDGKAFYRKLNEQGQVVAVTSADEMIKAYGLTRPQIYSAQGRPGVGGEHRGPGAPGEERVTQKSAVRDYLKQ